MTQKNSVQKSTLNNGVRILSRFIPGVRSVSMGIWVNTGSRDEAPEESGIAHFIEHMLFKGTARRDAYELAKAFDAIGGHANAFTASEHTCYHARALDTHLPQMTDLLSDIFLNSRFDPEEIDNERTVILQEIGIAEENPEEYVHHLFDTQFWGEHPLGRPIHGFRETVSAFDRERLVSYLSERYGAERVVIAAAGNLSHERLMDLVGPAFESLPRSENVPARETPHSHSGRQVYARDIEQAHICMGLDWIPLTDPRRFTGSLINTCLGGNMSSRLFQEIREKRGLAYSIYSYISAYADAGIFGVYAGVAPETADETITLVATELKRIADHGMDQAGLDEVREYTRGSVLLAMESTENQMVRLAQNEFNYGRMIPVSEVMDRIDAVTVSDIRDLAAERFGDRDPAITLLKPG